MKLRNPQPAMCCSAADRLGGHGFSGIGARARSHGPSRYHWSDGETASGVQLPYDAPRDDGWRNDMGQDRQGMKGMGPSTMQGGMLQGETAPGMASVFGSHVTPMMNLSVEDV